MIEVHAINKKKKKQRKYINSYNRKEKNMFDVHTVNQKKQRKYIDSYNMEEKKWLMCTM